MKSSSDQRVEQLMQRSGNSVDLLIIAEAFDVLVTFVLRCLWCTSKLLSASFHCVHCILAFLGISFSFVLP